MHADLLETLGHKTQYSSYPSEGAGLQLLSPDQVYIDTYFSCYFNTS